MIRSFRPGFTLIELLIVIGIIGILSFIVAAAVNPGRNLGDTRDTKRRSDVLALVNAVNQYVMANGNLPVGISLTAAGTPICKETAPACAGGVDLSFLVPTYLSGIPADPLATGDEAGYAISRDSRGRTMVVAPLSERTQNISAAN